MYLEIEGVLNLLVACEKIGIKRFILVGCISNIIAGKYRNVYNESHWADPDVMDDYERAKFFVEKCVWNFIEKKKELIKLTVFLPGLLIGPILKRGETSCSV